MARWIPVAATASGAVQLDLHGTGTSSLHCKCICSVSMLPCRYAGLAFSHLWQCIAQSLGSNVDLQHKGEGPASWSVNPILNKALQCKSYSERSQDLQSKLPTPYHDLQGIC